MIVPTIVEMKEALRIGNLTWHGGTPPEGHGDVQASRRMTPDSSVGGYIRWKASSGGHLACSTCARQREWGDPPFYISPCPQPILSRSSSDPPSCRGCEERATPRPNSRSPGPSAAFGSPAGDGRLEVCRVRPTSTSGTINSRSSFTAASGTAVRGAAAFRRPTGHSGPPRSPPTCDETGATAAG